MNILLVAVLAIGQQKSTFNNRIKPAPLPSLEQIERERAKTAVRQRAMEALRQQRTQQAQADSLLRRPVPPPKRRGGKYIRKRFSNPPTSDAVWANYWRSTKELRAQRARQRAASRRARLQRRRQ